MKEVVSRDLNRSKILGKDSRTRKCKNSTMFELDQLTVSYVVRMAQYTYRKELILMF